MNIFSQVATFGIYLSSLRNLQVRFIIERKGFQVSDSWNLKMNVQ